MAIVGWFLSQELNQENATNPAAVQDYVSNMFINTETLASLRALRDANPRLKSKLEPPPAPANPPSALSIWGDDYVLPGAVANPTRAPPKEDIFPDTDHRYWKKIATFDTKGNVNTLSLSAIRLTRAADLVTRLLEHVVTLDLANTHLPVDELASIMNAINEKSQSMQQLRLGGNCLDAEDLNIILADSAGFLGRLSSLDLRYNDLGPKGAERLVEALMEQENSCCTLLYLEGTQLGDKGAESLATLESIDEVYLGSNNIGPDGALHLATVAARSWKKLYLEGNQIGNSGAEAFIEALNGANKDNAKRLDRLFADNNGISKDMNLKLGNAVGSVTLIGESGIFQ